MRACVRAWCVRACERACVRACVSSSCHLVSHGGTTNIPRLLFAHEVVDLKLTRRTIISKIYPERPNNLKPQPGKLRTQVATTKANQGIVLRGLVARTRRSRRRRIRQGSDTNLRTLAGLISL